MPNQRSYALALCLCLLGACDSELSRAKKSLESANVRDRVHALHTLAERKDPALAADAAALLRDRNARVRRTAIYALGKLGPKPHVLELIERLSDRDIEVRLAAVRVLGESQSKRPRRALLRLLDDPTPLLRQATKRALSRLGMPAAQQQKALVTIYLKDDIDRLANASSQSTVIAATRRLGRSGRKEAIVPLERLLRAFGPSTIGQSAADALVAIGTKRSLSTVVAWAGSAKHRERLVAARALVKTKGVAAPLVKLLTDRNPDVRRAVREGLARNAKLVKSDPVLGKAVCGELAVERPWSELARLATATDGGPCLPQRAAIEAKAKTIVAKVKDSDARVLSAARVLIELGSAQALSFVTRLYAQHRAEAIKWVPASHWRQKGASSRPAKPLLRPRKPKQALKWLLSRYPERRAADALWDPLFAPQISAESLARLIVRLAEVPGDTSGGRSRLRGLGKWLVSVVDDDATVSVRVAAWRVLGENWRQMRAADVTSSPATVKLRAALRKALVGADPRIRRSAAAACALLGDEGEKVALGLLRAKDFELRAAAASCLARLAKPSSVDGLLAALAKEAQQDVIWALAAIGDRRAAPIIARQLRDDHPASRQGERVLLVSALGKLADPRTFRAVANELAHPRWAVRLAAARALIAIAESGDAALERMLAAKMTVCAEDYVAVVRRVCRGRKSRTGRP
jgi:HEAT repeat protein